MEEEPKIRIFRVIQTMFAHYFAEGFWKSSNREVFVIFKMELALSTPADALTKFRNWSKSRTVLKLTVFEKDAKPKIMNVQVTGIDKQNLLVGFCKHKSRNVFQIDLAEASFTVGSRMLMAERTNGEFLKCEEI